MSTETDNKNEVYTHFRRVVIVNTHGTQYLDPAHARTLARELLFFADAIESGKHPGTRTLADGKALSVATGKARRVFV